MNDIRKPYIVKLIDKLSSSYKHTKQISFLFPFFFIHSISQRIRKSPAQIVIVNRIFRSDMIFVSFRSQLIDSLNRSPRENNHNSLLLKSPNDYLITIPFIGLLWKGQTKVGVCEEVCSLFNCKRHRCVT